MLPCYLSEAMQESDGSEASGHGQKSDLESGRVGALFRRN